MSASIRLGERYNDDNDNGNNNINNNRCNYFLLPNNHFFLGTMMEFERLGLGLGLELELGFVLKIW